MATKATPVFNISEFQPLLYPPFPSGLPTIDLETISLAQLENGDEVEKERVFEICKSAGFFYLDLDGSQHGELEAKSESIALLSEEIFRLPAKEKLKYSPRPDARTALFGYKKAGRTVTDKAGTPDTAEFLNISKNELLRPDPQLPWPAFVLENKTALKEFAVAAHATGLLILSGLSTKLNLPPDALANLHRLEAPSGDHIRMIRGPPRKSKDMPEIQTPGHTDFGTITVLFNWLGGLQLWAESKRGHVKFSNVINPPGDNGGQWLWVAPKPGHAIVNLGDAAVKFTNGLFCSGRHRVVPAPGDQGSHPRYSVVYFVRPEDEAILKCMKSPGIIQPPAEPEEEVKAMDWIKGQAVRLTEKQ